MPYTCEVCGTVTEAKYGSGRFCRSECAKRYSSLMALEKLRAKQSVKSDGKPKEAAEDIIRHATAQGAVTATPAFTDAQIQAVTPQTIAVPTAKPSSVLATSYNREEQARASKPAPMPAIVNVQMPETVNVYVQYQKRARTREQMFKRMDNDMDEIRREIGRQFRPRYDLWRV